MKGVRKCLYSNSVTLLLSTREESRSVDEVDETGRGTE
jgi:hypothetical protein